MQIIPTLVGAQAGSCCPLQKEPRQTRGVFLKGCHAPEACMIEERTPAGNSQGMQNWKAFSGSMAVGSVEGSWFD